jgi:hypothetical protein
MCEMRASASVRWDMHTAYMFQASKHVECICLHSVNWWTAWLLGLRLLLPP